MGRALAQDQSWLFVKGRGPGLSLGSGWSLAELCLAGSWRREKMEVTYCARCWPEDGCGWGSECRVLGSQ